MDKFVTQDKTLIEADPINYKMFVKMFNGISADYKAVAFPSGNVAIKDEDGGEVIAELGSQSMGWQFDSSGFNWDELKLMADLASTMPIYRDKPDDDMAVLRKQWAETRLSEMKGDE